MLTYSVIMYPLSVIMYQLRKWYYQLSAIINAPI